MTVVMVHRHGLYKKAEREQVEMSVVLTLMRTNASMIEVNVSSSASAMSPLTRNLEGRVTCEKEKPAIVSCPWLRRRKAALHGPRQALRHGRCAILVPADADADAAHTDGASVLFPVWRKGGRRGFW